jgi:hypothetical protein
MSGMLGTGLPIAAEAFDFELYQTACTFAASSELARLSKDRPELGFIVRTFQLSEASRHLISLAAMIRSAMDTWSAPAEKNLKTPVGMLQANIDSDETGSLGFREACNKILHADSIELLSDQTGTDFVVLSYDVVLTGTKGERQWRATLNVPRFLAVASTVA